MTEPLDNFLTQIPARSDQEQFRDLLAVPGLRIERIVSTGQATPAGEWLAQTQAEWVLLVQGEAILRFATGPERRLRSGDHVHIPGGTRHRVEWTAEKPPTVWLAVHYDERAGDGSARSFGQDPADAK